MNLPKNKTYFPSIDFLRGLAAISVSLFHFVIISRLIYPSVFKELFNYGHLGVQVFFVISGFVIPYSMHNGNYTLKKIKVFFAKRIFRLEPPYITSILLVFLINFLFYLSPYYHEELINVSWEQLLYHFGYLNSIFQKGWVNQVYWSLGIEFQYYILIAFIFIFINNKTVIWLITFAILSVLSLIFTSQSFIFTHLPYFIIGILFFRFFTKKDSKYTFIFFIITTLIIILYKYQWNIQYIVTAIIPFPFFFYKRTFKVGQFLGKISYSLYLIHIPIGQGIIKIGSDFTNNVYSESLLIFLTLCLTIFFSYIFYRIIEKPSKNFTCKFKYDN